MNHYIQEKMLEERRREMLCEAKRLQLLATYEASRQGRRAKLLAAVGERLVRLGERLIQRYGDREKRCIGRSENRSSSAVA